MGEDIDDFDVDAEASEDADRLIFAKVIEYHADILFSMCVISQLCYAYFDQGEY